MRIRFLSDQIYETGGVGKGPRFPKGFVLDETGVAAALGLNPEPSPDWVSGFMHRWLQRGVAEEVDGRTPVTGDAEAEVPAEHEERNPGDDGADAEDAEDAGQPEGADLSKLTRAQLDALAAERGVDISEAKNKADVIATLELAAQ